MFSLAEKRAMSETDIRSKFITSAIRNAGWNDRQIREEYSFKADKQFTDGRMLIDPKTKKPAVKRANGRIICCINPLIAKLPWWRQRIISIR